VLRDAEGSIYGGYLDVAWSSSGAWASSAAAFLFAIASSKAPAVMPLKMPLKGTGNSQAGYCHAGQGPTFGSGNDLRVSADGRAACAIGGTYAVGAAGATLSSTSPVAVAAMEVWQLSDA
jgi:hypothetical protein